ncbi:MAG: tripartite tricarboxylate transporter TctB family protein [Deltaproteobacteria bacterium]|nr:tripartite tricarboxylate transporter TctB family protein [Deltaproteobacteria bacterium]
MSKKMEVVGSVFLVVLGITHTYLSFFIEVPLLQQDVNTLPSYVPILGGVIFTALALFELIRAVVTGTRKDGVESALLSFRQIIPGISLLAVFLAYIILMQIFGWILCSVVTVTAVMTIAEWVMKRRKRILVNFLLGMGMSAIAFTVFDYLLDVPLPVGIWSIECLLGI